ncbi:hypothetical protein [Noviherbaspirillum suwonense]|uniref:Ethyl tert-butyl ether degradation protein EthD n=1 Tax=Noviherbaspirillum suwonense TaxID=1224511 RepID=A0ABY1QUM5_9BURK|nr:hypothetical protein [Noviherbaspirillum suwonense]SMP81356.1 hypothetical protein SAMN06295970_14318 [Noviherbaspirillum suwonense]
MQNVCTSSAIPDAKLLEGFDKAAAAYTPAAVVPRQMTTIPFSQVPIDGTFFDPHCGEDFVKVSATRAQMASIGSDPNGPDSFGADEMVEVEFVTVQQG